ncbi:MAG: DUF1559 domain-containing protein, partial [Planctomycetaceae bacterium]|nr:DUF1559 domain-containing protein [Planctomycetaceae bacterium]
KQIALALTAYDASRKELPPMRWKIYEAPKGSTYAGRMNYASWVGFILPQLEYNQFYSNMKSEKFFGVYNTDFFTSDGINKDGDFVGISILQCRSAVNAAAKDAKMNYVVNGGYQNAIGTDWKADPTDLRDPFNLKDALFFDNLHSSDTLEYVWQSSTIYPQPYESRKCGTLDYITGKSGTSNVILLSENIQGGLWGWYGTTRQTMSHDERSVAFCYPFNTNIGNIATKPDRYWRHDVATGWSHQAYESDVDITYSYAKNPGWLNNYRDDVSADKVDDLPYRVARPSSYHPGMVVAAFADNSVRTLSDTMSKEVFVYICCPDSGKVVDVNKL